MENLDAMSILIVIGLTYWLTARYYKKKFGIKTVQIIERPDPEDEPESLAKQAYRKHKERMTVKFED